MCEQLLSVRSRFGVVRRLAIVFTFIFVQEVAQSSKFRRGFDLLALTSTIDPVFSILVAPYSTIDHFRLQNHTVLTMILGQIAWVDCFVFLVLLAPQLLIHVGLINTFTTVIKALPFFRKLPVDRWRRLDPDLIQNDSAQAPLPAHPRTMLRPHLSTISFRPTSLSLPRCGDPMRALRLC